MPQAGRNEEERFPAYRPLVPAAVAFAGGIAGREFLHLPAVAVWGGLIGAVALFPLLRWAGRRGLALGFLYLGIVGVGWVRLDVAVGRRPEHHVARFLGGEAQLVKLRGVVASDPETRELPPVKLAGDSQWLASGAREVRFDLDVLEAKVGERWLAATGRLRAVQHEPSVTPGYGDTVVAIGVARLPSPPSNPGQMDGATLLRRKGIDGVLSLGRDGLVVEPGRRGRGLVAATHAARGWLRETLKTTLAPGAHAASLLCALTLGDRTDVDDDLAEAFARTGTIHLLAVSGFNVAVVAWVMWTLTSLAGLGQRAAGALVLCAVGVYALVTGAPPSVVRATVMSGAYVLSIIGRRQSDAVHAAALAALVLLAARPFDLFQPGFQLSFAAVFGILLLTEDLAAMLGPRESLLERVAGPSGVGLLQRIRRRLHRLAAMTGSVSIAAWLAVLPLTAYYFHLFSPVTVLVNLVVVPMAGFLTVFGFAHLGVAACSPMLAHVPAFLARGVTGLLTQIVMGAERLAAGWVYCAAPALGWVIGYYALGLLVVARGRLGLSGRRAAMLWLVGVLVYVVAGGSGRPPRGFEATMLDVQDGAAAVLRFPDGATVLCDAGTYGRNDVGRWVVAPALWHWGVRSVDLLVVTHADADHVTGLPSLLDRFRVGRVVHSPVLERAAAGRQLLALLDERGIPHQSVAAGDRLAVGDGNVIEVLWPNAWSLRLRPGDQNENSLVLRVERDGRRVLLGGDIQQVGMTALLHCGVDLRTDALVVPHHGRRVAVAEAFAQATRPSYAICSIRPDHLPPDTVAAYSRAGAEVLVTGRDGAVTVTLLNGEALATRWRSRDGGIRAAIAFDGEHLFD